MNKIVKAVIVGLLVFFLLASIAIYAFVRSSFATSLQYEGEDIQIERDQFNIPSIRAPTLRSALYAWGYAQAEDRLFQLAFRRASVKGQLCQYLGQKALDIDKMFREINLYGWAVKSAQRLLKENVSQYDNFKAFSQGISDYYKSLTFKPLQFYMTGMKWEQWTVADTFGLYKLLKWSLSFGMADQYIRSSLLNNFTKQQVDEFLPYEPKYWLKGEHATHTTITKDDEIPQEILQRSKQIKFQNFKPVSVQKMQKLGYFQFLDVNQRASNSWAISGKHTDTGHPLLCNDPHLDSALPGQWHQVKIFYRGLNGEQVYVMGGSAVGMPLIVGKTTYGAVSITTNYIDSQDLFKQQIEGNKYYLDGVWRQLKIRNQTINIKGSKPIHYIIQQTHRGPLIKHIGSKGYLYKTTMPVSLAWTGFTDAEYLSLVPYIHMAEIRDYNQMQKLLAECTDYGPPFNLVYITKDNHIGYSSIGVIPIRKTLHAGMYVKNGTTSQNDWVGVIKGTDKLNFHDPQRGYIVTANNKAATDKYFNGVLDSSIFTGRANRLEQLIKDQLAAGRKLSKDFMRKLQLDTVDTYCLEIVKGMRQKLATGDLTYKFVFSIFEYFDCNFSSISTTSSFYLTLIQNIYEQVHPEGKNPTFILSNFLPFHQYIYRFILKQHDEQDLKKLNNSMFDSLKQLRTYFQNQNPSTYKYGQLHKDLMIHRPFSYVQSLKRFFEHEGPGFGNWNTPNVGYMNKFHEKDYRTNHRANMRLIMSYFEDSQWIIDGGTNQKPYSRHYKDQLETFMSGGYNLMDAWNRTADII